MNLQKNFFILFFLIILSSNLVSAYEKHQPIMLKNIHATPENPYIIEGYEISNPYGDCVTIKNSENIIIRNNYFHDCGTDEKFRNSTDHYSEGYAVLIGDSSDIIFENNTLNNNFRGFMAYNTQKIKATKNNITNTLQYSPLWCEVCDNSEFYSNYLSDNGNPMHFWVPSDRSIGIWIKKSDNLKIHDNTIIRSTSDGISVTGHIYTPSFTIEGDKTKPGPQADWSGLSNNIEIYNNLILDNMEQGVWLVNARKVRVYNNTIRTGCFTYGSPISTEFNVGNSEFYNNKLLGCLVKTIGGANSFNISVYNNIFYSYDGSKGDFAYFSDDFLGVGELANRQGAIFQNSTGNKERNNTWVFIKGTLAEEMKEKIDYANKHETYKPRGWWICQKSDGTIDEECKEREEAKGEQGVPKNMLYYSSLMENFDLFVDKSIFHNILSKEKEQEEKEIITESLRKEEKTGIAYVIEQLIESWKATIAIAIIILLIIVLLILYKRRRRFAYKKQN